ncbi:MAG: DNA replication and repair protein RecF [Candidatus Saccharibacteria bacterium]
MGILRELEVVNFRSYEKAKFLLDPGVTLVVGPNASGKTNLLESLFVLASTKSFRAKDRDLIRHGEDFFRIVARGDDGETTFALSTERGPLEKRATKDGVKRPLVHHVGEIQIVLFETTELGLISGAPEGRRKYLDFILCQTDREYLKTMQLYRRALKQRNALLDGFDIERIRSQVFSWDVKLTELALGIYERRQKLISYLNARIGDIYSQVAGQEAQLEIEYISTVDSVDYGSGFLEALTQNLPRDLATGFTTIGPHREDFKVTFKNSDMTAVASRGEIRTAVLALKLVELHYAEETSGQRPLLLLDDVFSELDRERRTFLIEKLNGYQSVITTTDADAVTKEIQTSYSIISTDGARV